MPRPLIMKVETHKLQPNKKATGSINTQLLKENRSSLYGSYSQDLNGFVSVTDNDQINRMEESGSGGLVRSLISRYESSASATRSTLIKNKSKSLSDLLPQFSYTKRTQENLNSYHGGGESQDQSFNFKKVFSKFENDKGRFTYERTNVYQQTDNNNNLENFNKVKDRARELLEGLEKSYDDSGLLTKWQNDVVEFLQQLNNWSGDMVEKKKIQKWHLNKESKNEESYQTYQTNILAKSKSLDSSGFSTGLKVKEAKNIFETKIAHANTKPIARSISLFSSYFTGKPTEDSPNKGFEKQNSEFSHNSNFTNNTGSEGDEDSGNEGFYDFQGTETNRLVTEPVLISCSKVQQLKNLFESDSGDKYVPYEEHLLRTDEDTFVNSSFDTELNQSKDVIEERLLPPAKIVTLDEEAEEHYDLEGSKKRIDELTSELEEYDVKIENISQEDKEEGSYINEGLIKILVKLDDVKTYGDGVIQTERRKALQFVQNCIKKLRGKIRGYE